jgi:hypothetical protein
MAISAAITAVQSSDKTAFLITDTTPYAGLDSQANFSARTIVIYTSDGTIYDTLDFSFASYPDDEIEVTDLDKDYAFSIVMTLTPIAAQSGSVYSIALKKAFSGYAMTALRERMRKCVEQERYEKSRDFITDTFVISLSIEAADAAIADNDLESAQLALTRAKKIAFINRLPY